MKTKQTDQTKINEAKAFAAAMAEEILASSRDLNHILTGAEVAPVFQAHYVETKQGQNGIADLICSILADAGAIFPANVGNTEQRPQAIAKSLTSKQIRIEVIRRFSKGSSRYPMSTIATYLTRYLPKSQRVGCLRLTSAEDVGRECSRPRHRWFLIAGQ